MRHIPRGLDGVPGFTENKRLSSRIVSMCCHKSGSGRTLLTSEDNGRIDPAVVAALYAQHADELRAFLIGVLRNRESAADALQTTFSRLLEKGHTAKEEHLKGWLFRVAYNEAMLLRRRSASQQNSLQRAAWLRESGEAGETPGDSLVRLEEIENVRRALQKLSEEQRAVVHSRIHEQKTFAVIAEELGLPLGTVLTRMRLALRNLQQHLDRHGNLEADEKQ